MIGQGVHRTVLGLSLCLSIVGCQPARLVVPHNLAASPLREDARNRLSSLGIIASEPPSGQVTPELAIGTLFKGGGHSQEGAAGALCLASGFVTAGIGCLVAFGIAGLATAASEAGSASGNEMRRAESAVKNTLSELLVYQKLRESLIGTAREETGQAIKEFSDRASADSDQIIEIDGYVIEFLPWPTSYLTFRMATHVRVLQRATEQEIYSDDFEYFGRTTELLIWGANDAQHLREEFQLACQALAEQITESLFLLYRFPTTPSSNSAGIKSGMGGRAVTLQRKS